jgi:non-ribosomal peptide synthetase component E (peptide arylation enzyme)
MDGQVLTLLPDSWAPQTLGDVLERQARERGGAEALVTRSGRFTFKDLLEKASSAAGGDEHGEELPALQPVDRDD